MNTDNTNPIDPLDLFPFVEATLKAPLAVREACNRLIMEEPLTLEGLNLPEVGSMLRTHAQDRTMELEAIRLTGGWFVRPLGQLGSAGWHPVPWEMTYIKGARSESDAITRAKRPGAVRWYKEV